VIRARSAQEQPVDEMIVLSGDPSAGRARVVHLGADAHRRMPGRVIHKPRFRPPRYARQAWLHPLLERWLRDPSRAPRRAQLVVVFPDSLQLPPFPTPGSAGHLAGHDRQTDSLIASIRRRRAARYEADSAAMASRGVEVLDKAWLIQAVLVDAPIGPAPISFLRGSLGALSVEPRESRKLPPVARTPFLGDDPEVGRSLMQSDPWRASPQAGEVALLDSGVLRLHELFTSAPSNPIAHWWDCTPTTGGCVSLASPPAPTSEPCFAHGTRAAAILSGKDNLGTRYDGVTGAPLGVFVTYKPLLAGPCSSANPAKLDTWAGERAIEEARATNHPIVVAEIACPVDPTPEYPADRYLAIAAAADRVYETGTLVIAAAGNVSGKGKIASPAVARRVIAVGAYNLKSLNPVSGSVGPTPDGRTKPELIGPTSAQTGSSGGTADYAEFGATSGATAFVAGAATLIRNRLLQASPGGIDPGQVCALLMLAGQSPSTKTGSGSTATWSFDPSIGAGKVALPDMNAQILFGKTVIASTHDVLPIAIPLPACTVTALQAALWWPESGSHNDIDLEIMSPLVRMDDPQDAFIAAREGGRPCVSYMGSPGQVMADSRTGPDVFERATARDPASSGFLQGGAWTVNVIGYDVPAGPQTVYWAVLIRP